MIPSPWTRLANLWRSTTAVTSIEYALIATGIAMAIVGTVRVIGTDIEGFFIIFAEKL